LFGDAGEQIPHFGLKYLSNNGIDCDHFHSENFLKIYTFRPAKKMPGLILSGVYL